MRDRDVVRILNCENARIGSVQLRSVQHIPVNDTYVPPELCFPFAVARKLAIESMCKLAPPGLPPAPPQLALPFAEEAGETVSSTIDLGLAPPARPPRLKNTFKRMLELGTTDGCQSCEEISKLLPHTAECRA